MDKKENKCILGVTQEQIEFDNSQTLTEIPERKHISEGIYIDFLKLSSQGT